MLHGTARMGGTSVVRPAIGPAGIQFTTSAQIRRPVSFECHRRDRMPAADALECRLPARGRHQTSNKGDRV